MKITATGLDLAKELFQIYEVDAHSQAMLDVLQSCKSSLIEVLAGGLICSPLGECAKSFAGFIEK